MNDPNGGQLGPPAPNAPARNSYAAWLPGPGGLVFLFVLATVLLGVGGGFLNDPGTPWHLRLGRDILSTGAVPRVDALTYTHQGEDWVDQSWAFDVLLALVVDHWGWTGAIALAALGLAALYGTLARDLARDGVSPWVAVVVAIVAESIGSIHFLVRPHLFTFAFVYWTLRACQRQHERGGFHVFWAVLYTALLANLHGGFIALPLIVATAAVGHAICGAMDAPRRLDLVKYGAAFALALLAGLLNPYGAGLYHHVVGLLMTSGVTHLIAEYQPAPFGQPIARALELALVGLIVMEVFSRKRVDLYQLPHVLVWLHLALTSIRNAPLFALVAAPALAALADGLPLSDSMRVGWKRNRFATAWPAAAAMLVMSLALRGTNFGDYTPEKWPLAALGTLDRQPVSARLFHEQDWGGLIEAQCQPVRGAYLDDRFEIFGKDAILEYIDVLSGGPAWDAVRDRDRINLVWLRPDRGLAKRLLREPEWTVLHRDKVSILFERARATGQLTAR